MRKASSTGSENGTSSRRLRRLRAVAIVCATGARLLIKRCDINRLGFRQRAVLAFENPLQHAIRVILHLFQPYRRLSLDQHDLHVVIDETYLLRAQQGRALVRQLNVGVENVALAV